MTKRAYPLHLIIPDSHAQPDICNRRYEALGNLIMDIRPDVIINLGDHADMKSLCTYDYGKKSFEGRRYKADIASAIDANERLFEPLLKYNRTRTAWKKKQYNPRAVMCIGNHEYRINKAIEDDAKLDGVLSIDDLEYECFYDDVVPFLEPIIIDGIAYCHYFTSGVMGRPVSGKHQAMSLLDKMHISCTQGHTHTMDYGEQIRADGKRIIGHVAGCFFEHDESYAGPANRMYNRGITLKHEVNNGSYDIQRISMECIIRDYL